MLRTETIESFAEKVPIEFKEDVKKAIYILKDTGCKEVYIFGSLAKGESTKKSDIDLAIRNYPVKKFFHIYGKLYMELVHSVDLVDLDMDAYFGDYLEKEGGLVRVL